MVSLEAVLQKLCKERDHLSHVQRYKDRYYFAYRECYLWSVTKKITAQGVGYTLYAYPKLSDPDRLEFVHLSDSAIRKAVSVAYSSLELTPNAQAYLAQLYAIVVEQHLGLSAWLQQILDAQ